MLYEALLVKVVNRIPVYLIYWINHLDNSVTDFRTTLYVLRKFGTEIVLKNFYPGKK